MTDPAIARSEVRRDVLTPGLVHRFAATFGRDEACLPARGIHWCLCVPDAPTDMLSADGHVPRGEFMPQSALERRMWAASEVTFRRPLHVDAMIERRSTIVAVNEKSGASGCLVFVEVRHETFADDALADAAPASGGVIRGDRQP
jgi:3-methylfumaryl-CoA hydratase